MSDTVLLRAQEVVGRKVVTLAGELEAEIKDLIFDRGAGRLDAFTLNNPGLFSRSRKDALPWSGVHGMGRDAVMIADKSALVPTAELADKREAKQGNVLGNRVLTDSGTDLGKVVDVILQVGAIAEIVGYEIEASEALGTAGRKVLIPLPDTRSVSGENLIVPGAATEFVSSDLAGFGAAVDAFRSRLREQS